MAAALTSATGPATAGRPRRTFVRLGVVLAGLVLVAWVALGVVRGEAVARDYFATTHGVGATVTNVAIEASGSALPPFWSVTIGGDVIQAGQTTPVYRSHMILWVEPITGWVIVQAAG